MLTQATESSGPSCLSCLLFFFWHTQEGKAGWKNPKDGSGCRWGGYGGEWGEPCSHARTRRNDFADTRHTQFFGRREVVSRVKHSFHDCPTAWNKNSTAWNKNFVAVYMGEKGTKISKNQTKIFFLAQPFVLDFWRFLSIMHWWQSSFYNFLTQFSCNFERSDHMG